MLIIGRHPLSPWHAPNTGNKSYPTVVEGSVKEERILNWGTWAPEKSKLIPYYKWNISLALSQRMTFFLPKFTFLRVSLNAIILTTLTYEVQIFLKLQPFSIRNYKVIYSLP